MTDAEAFDFWSSRVDEAGAGAMREAAAPSLDRAVATTRVAAELAAIADRLCAGTDVQPEEALLVAAMPYLLRGRRGLPGPFLAALLAR